MKFIKTLMITGILAVSAMLSGCGGKEEDKVLNIGYFNNVTHGQALYMKATGALEEVMPEDMSVSWTAFNAGPAEVEALFAGDIDLGYIGPVPAITANVRSDGDVMVLTGASKAGAVLVKSATSGIKSISDLAGKTIAIPQIGNTQHLCLLKLLADNNLKTVENGGDVVVTAVENADVQNMMDQGNIDAALVPEPWGTTLVSSGAEILLDYDEVYKEGDYPVAVVVVRKEFMETYPEVVETFLAQHELATEHLTDNVEEAAVVVNKEINDATGKSLTEDILFGAFDKIEFAQDINEDAMKEFGDISVEQSFIKENYKEIFVK